MRKLPLDPRRLPVLQRRLDVMRDMARGLMAEIRDIERRRDLASAHLSHLKQRWQRWKATQSVPPGIHHPAEAAAIQEAFNTPALSVATTESEIAELDAELSSKEAAHAALQSRLQPLGQLVQACERHMGRPNAVLRGTLTGVIADVEAGNVAAAG
jgi:hypothetical protein